MACARTVATVDAVYGSWGGVYGWVRAWGLRRDGDAKAMWGGFMYRIARIVMDDDDDDDDDCRRRECCDARCARASGAGLDFARARLR